MKVYQNAFHFGWNFYDGILDGYLYDPAYDGTLDGYLYDKMRVYFDILHDISHAL